MLDPWGKGIVNLLPFLMWWTCGNFIFLKRKRIAPVSSPGLTFYINFPSFVSHHFNCQWLILSSLVDIVSLITRDLVCFASWKEPSTDTAAQAPHTEVSGLQGMPSAAVLTLQTILWPWDLIMSYRCKFCRRNENPEMFQEPVLVLKLQWQVTCLVYY